MVLRMIPVIIVLAGLAACSSPPPESADSGKLNVNNDRGSFIGTEGSNAFTQHLWWLGF